MNHIDHNNASFDRNVLLRGYYCQRGADVLFYGKAVGNDVHVIAHDRDGYWEFTQKHVLPYRSVESCIDSLAESVESDNAYSWYADSLD